LKQVLWSPQIAVESCRRIERYEPEHERGIGDRHPPGIDAS